MLNEPFLCWQGEAYNPQSQVCECVCRAPFSAVPSPPLSFPITLAQNFHLAFVSFFSEFHPTLLNWGKNRCRWTNSQNETWHVSQHTPSTASSQCETPSTYKHDGGQSQGGQAGEVRHSHSCCRYSWIQRLTPAFCLHSSSSGPVRTDMQPGGETGLFQKHFILHYILQELNPNPHMHLTHV